MREFNNNGIAQPSIGLFINAANQSSEKVKELITRGKDINATDSEGNTALMNAIEEGISEVARLEAKNAENKTALIDFAKQKALEIIECLADNGADVNKKNINGRTPLMYAVMGAHLEIVKCLLDRGADVNIQDSKGNTALSYIGKTKSSVQDGELIQCLLDKGADINIKDEFGKNFLERAACKGIDWMGYLIRPDVNLFSNDPKTKAVISSINCKSTKELLNKVARYIPSLNDTLAQYFADGLKGNPNRLVYKENFDYYKKSGGIINDLIEKIEETRGNKNSEKLYCPPSQKTVEAWVKKIKGTEARRKKAKFDDIFAAYGL
ncbi:ankyrin repeat domain-containing protein [Holosporaceae bacterium 'Namur']|nr:ankyrin repeat domain-containing protein [Holosporaceae bacterium 'Namur']